MNFKKNISRMMVLFLAFSMVLAVPGKKVHADAYKVVTIGADLNQTQKEDMLKYFKVNKEEVNLLEVNKSEEDKYLSGIATQKEIGTRSISCSYVEPTNRGGINVTTHNIYWVTENMIKNALITAGIENAEVKAAAPFNVSGTAALTGILKGFENSKGGKKIDEKNKKVANEEMMVTGKLGDKIGQDEAAGLINEIKKEVVKESPKTKQEIEKIVVNVVNNFNQSLSQDDIKKITGLMDKINGLDLDFSKIKSQLNDVTKQLKGTLTSDEAKGFFAKLFEAIKNFFSSIFDGPKESTEAFNIMNTNLKVTRLNI